MTSYATAGLQPFVKDVAVQIASRFAVPSIAGYRPTATDMTGHPAGLAVDFQVGQDRAKGQQVADYVTANYGALRVKYVLWQQRAWYPGKGWAGMGWRGLEYGSDPNHLRHVHVSFTSSAAAGDNAGTIPAGSSSGGGITGGESVADWLNPADNWAAQLAPLTSGETWKRVAMVLGGAGLITGGALILFTSSDAAPAALAAIPTPHTKAAGAALALTKGA